MSSDSEDEELACSELGTIEYWNKTYTNEIKNFKDHGDVGEVWFGEDSALRIVRWLCDNDLVKREDRILDIGCGNGMLLVELARENFRNLTGIDYSQYAIELAKSVTRKQNLDISYKVYDILADHKDPFQDGLLLSEFDIALDKGTYDAISLHPEDAGKKRAKYIDNVQKVISQKGLFILTSCNWTQEELVSHFNDKFRVIHTIPTPKFQFGGKTGSLITSLVFQKI